MDIVWFGNSCFRLQAAQATVLTDPFDALPPAALNGVDIVTVSRRAWRDRVPEIPGARLVDGPGEYEIKGVPVAGVATDAGEGTRNFVYIVTLDGMAVCHLGRLPETPSAARLQEIGQPDVLLFPLGEPGGLPANRAVQLASQMEARVLVPMTLGGPNDAASLESFCKELGADPAARETRFSISATAAAAGTRVAVLVPQGTSGGAA